MKHRRTLLLISLLLVFCLVLTGCTLPFRRPTPQRVPEQTPAPQPQPPGARTQPTPGQPAPGAIDMGNRVAEIATDVEGVDSSVAVIVSNIALVGITLDRGEAAARDENEIKQEVARRIEDREPAVVNAYVSANPDIVRQLREISRGVQRGEPVSAFFDQLIEVLQRMRAETNNNN